MQCLLTASELSFSETTATPKGNLQSVYRCHYRNCEQPCYLSRYLRSKRIRYIYSLYLWFPQRFPYLFRPVRIM